MTDLNTTLTTTWEGLTHGNGRIKSSTMDLTIAIPQTYGGTGEGSHPKELLMASAASCYVMTFAGMPDARKLPLAGMTVYSALSDMHKQGMYIVHDVRIVLSADAAQDRVQAAEALIAAADKACMVGNLLKTAGVQISVSGTVTIAPRD
ncbi:TPA: OsmC family protein [Burkholderia vietnamiensis]|nr:OsmC family protein [Burkholderia vietnamiensis]